MEEEDLPSAIDDKETADESLLKRMSLMEERLNEVLTARQLEFSRSYLDSLCSNLSLPGVRYINDRGEPRAHRWLWGILHVVALLISFSYIREAHQQWLTSPIVQSVNNYMTRVDEIPFPAVTVCEPLVFDPEPYTEFSPEEILDRCANGTNWSCGEDELNRIELAHTIFPIRSFKHYYSLPKILDHNKTFSGSEYLRFLNTLKLEVKYDFNLRLIHHITEETIMPIATSDFLSGDWLAWCHSFNDVKHGPVYLENVTKHELNLVEDRPAYNISPSCSWTPESMMTAECRNSSGLIYTRNRVYSLFDETLDKIPTDPLIFVNNPAEYLDTQIKHGQTLPKGKTMTVFLVPKLIIADPYLFDIEPQYRGCAFSKEIKLHLFELYTRQNCLFECQVNCAIAKCGCIPRRMPIFNASVRVCGYFKSSECYRETNNLDYDSCACNCPTDCVSLSYEVETKLSDFPSVQRSFRIEFKNLEFVSSVRHSVTNPSEFAAYCLGILGVFNGFSLMLVWEFLYWITLRLWVYIGRAQFI